MSYSQLLSSLAGGGLQVWSKEQGLGPCRAGVRGFKSHPPHFWLLLSLYSVFDAAEVRVNKVDINTEKESASWFASCIQCTADKMLV